MESSLARLASTIASKSRPTYVFFRNDDGGWADQRLVDLCGLMQENSLPLDVAVIPGAINSESRKAIMDLHAQGPSLTHLHQHGLNHVNHESSGRKGEFSESRSFEQQFEDIRRGQTLLREAFGDAIEPMFTPPWNRCTRATVLALKELKFVAVSRITGSDPIECGSLKQVDVSVDWLKKKDGKRLSWAQFCHYAEEKFRRHTAVGVMLHHEHMDADELSRFIDFVHMLRDQPRVIFCSMRELCDWQVDSALR